MSLQQLFLLLVTKQHLVQQVALAREMQMVKDVIAHPINKMQMARASVKYMEKHQHPDQMRM